MAGKIIDLQQIRALKEAGIEWGPGPSLDDLPLSFSTVHCAAARAMLNWSVEALSFRSGVSVKAIRELEEGRRTLRQVTMQALSFALEAEGLVFLPGLKPMRGQNCRGGTTDPRKRDDFHMIE
ncbi:helix-turn-helix domain-containing protein [Pseudomonas sp. 6D_7.1_Bac1]|uniref:helix-turn-helix domain-containing protein n=1 Tax=Pseudomonas sp. 6D_7.1_Bac1 TaxID=2971615 RepID=UPI0021C6DDB6|nr:helix-turn-helix transcriptional regulator [Pseudomonas sp. 6D_7.1_Bac1]MCU1751614.1 helix-turn-helix transcriptional regulator [Pseudomonas sp. 6D_7.1_Bac1]